MSTLSNPLNITPNSATNTTNTTLPTIVFAEGEDKRIQEAATYLANNQLVHPILITRESHNLSHNLSHDPSQQPLEGITTIACTTSPHLEEFTETYYQLRKHKGCTHKKAAERAIDPLVFANLMVHNGHADGTVAGAVYTTADVVRNAIQVIGINPETSPNKTVSSFFLMLANDTPTLQQAVLFADCALIIEPNTQQLTDIALMSVNSYQRLTQNTAKVAMLSFSTAGSSKHPQAIKVAQATQQIRQQRSDLCIDGEIQFDAAVVPSIAQRKMPNGKTQGESNIFIFPSLESANIGYKIAERMGGYQAVGPILQGLAKPCNDLSRGCNSQDVVNVALLTAQLAIS